MEWFRLDRDMPSKGQRCIVWDDRENRAIFAYYRKSNQEWEHRGYFYEMMNGVERPVQALFWMEEPDSPLDYPNGGNKW